MKESVTIAKEADTMSSPTKSDKSIHRARNEPERQLGSLRSVIDNIRSDGGTPSVDSIATELSGMHTAQRASVLLALHRTHGNRYVQRVVAGIHAKLVVGQPRDKYEQEADRVAEQVISMPEPQVQRQPEEEEELVQTKLLAKQITHLVQRPVEEEEKGEEMLQAKSREDATSEVSYGFESQINAIKGGGRPLGESERAYFEPRFGYDFCQVRLHTDTRAAETAQAVNARAFTVGRDIVFGAAEYALHGREGRWLLAHELTHVVQQRGQGQVLQRFVACEGAEQCPPRARGELGRSLSTPHEVEIYDPSTFGVLVSNFAIDEHRPKPDLASNVTWVTFVRCMPSTPHGLWEILGFTDCLGAGTRNQALRLERAAEMFSSLPSAASAQVSRVDAANLADCVSDNLSESGRSRNRSALIRRLPGSTGPTAPPGPAPIGPVRPPGSPGSFCVPYTNSIEAATARLWLETVWLNFARGQFGTEVHNLWRDYLNRPKGASLAPRVFRGRGHRIVDAFRADPQTVCHQRLLYADIRAAAARTPEANVPFTGNSYTSPPIRLGTLLPAASLIRTINYRDPANRIPGNIAGGTGVMGTGSSDAGPDLRLFTGTVRISRTRRSPGSPEVKTAHIELQLQVIDAVDFCPGAAGGFLAQRFTIPMSRLEATPTERTYDLPFHVFVDLSGTVRLP